MNGGRLVEVMADEPRLRDKKFAGLEGRLHHEEELDGLISSWTISRTAEEITRELQQAGVAAFPCMDIGDCFLDPHYQEREVFIPIEHPVSGDEFIANLSWKMSVTNGEVDPARPLIGSAQPVCFRGYHGNVSRRNCPARGKGSYTKFPGACS